MNMRHLHHKKLIIIGSIFAGSWILGTFLIHDFEAAQWWNYFDSFYFTVITTATIGFGDLVPHSIAGKILTMWYAVFYVPLFLYAMTLVFQIEFEKIRSQDELLEKEMHDVEADVEEILREKWGTRKRVRKD